MKIVEEALNGVVLMEPRVFGDPRGYFFESFRQSAMEGLLNGDTFIQDNESFSAKGVLRGMHFQAPPYAQGKLVRVTSGAVQDVAVDLRKDSSTYGQHFGAVLSEENKWMMWIPPGFAHGFLTLKAGTRFLYKCTSYYNKQSEGGLMWNDTDLGIKWELENPLVSEKDLEFTPFTELNSPF